MYISGSETLLATPHPWNYRPFTNHPCTIPRTEAHTTYRHLWRDTDLPTSLEVRIC